MMVAPFRAWPYAALAVVNWLYTTPSLFCWVVFRHPMDQDVKPPLAKWIVDVDDATKTPASSAWVDEWTLLLTVTLDGVKPAIVYVAYDGPHEDLRTTWGKQWEPWGPILATSFQVMPSGITVMWPFAIEDIPPGWVLCDGNNGTPNLNLLFMLGTTGALPPGTTGGGINHDHTFTGDGHDHTQSLTPPLVIGSGTTYSRKSSGVYVTGTTDAGNHMPPWFAMPFIMKV